jgi:Transglutaminase-like superfamily
VTKIAKLFRLRPRDRRLLLEAFACLAACRVRFALQTFAQLEQWGARMGHGTAPVNRLVWAFNVALGPMPGTTCLCQALALRRLLARHRHSSALRIGVNRTQGHFRAHAWLVHEGQVLIGGAQLHDYELLLAPHPRCDIAPRASKSSLTS